MTRSFHGDLLIGGLAGKDVLRSCNSIHFSPQILAHPSVRLGVNMLCTHLCTA